MDCRVGATPAIVTNVIIMWSVCLYVCHTCVLFLLDGISCHASRRYTHVIPVHILLDRASSLPYGKMGCFI